MPAFRRLLVTLGLSSLGDWVGLLATTALAASLGSGFAGGSYAIGGVLVLRLLPSVLFGPVAGALADRLDRRWSMVVCDVVRAVLFASIPLVGTLTWLFVATFLVELASLLWIPAKEASVPNLVPASRLESANSLSLFFTYGTAPVAALLFAVLAKVTEALSDDLPGLEQVDLALYANAGTFAVAALVVATLPQISRRGVHREEPPDEPGQPAAEATRLPLRAALADGLRYARRTPLVQATLVGLSGAFVAAGTIIATGRPYAGLLGAGDAGYGVLFGVLFVGLAVGLVVGSRLLPGVDRRRTAGLCVLLAGGLVVVVAFAPTLEVAAVAVTGVGLVAGAGYVTVLTLLGLETDDQVRGRTFAIVQVMTRAVLLLSTAVAPFVVGAVGVDGPLGLSGVTVALVASGVVAVAAGVVSLRVLARDDTDTGDTGDDAAEPRETAEPV